MLSTRTHTYTRRNKVHGIEGQPDATACPTACGLACDVCGAGFLEFGLDQLGLTTFATNMKMVPRGLEPRTLWLLAIRSNQLSYETLKMQRPAISCRSNLNASIGAGQGEALH